MSKIPNINVTNHACQRAVERFGVAKTAASTWIKAQFIAAKHIEKQDVSDLYYAEQSDCTLVVRSGAVVTVYREVDSDYEQEVEREARNDVDNEFISYAIKRKKELIASIGDELQAMYDDMQREYRTKLIRLKAHEGELQIACMTTNNEWIHAQYAKGVAEINDAILELNNENYDNTRKLFDAAKYLGYYINKEAHKTWLLTD